MNKTIMTCLLVLLGNSSAAFAYNRMNLNQAPYSREELKAALTILLDAGVITIPENSCPIVNTDLLEELRDLGVLKPGVFRTSSICIDGGK